MKDPQHLFGVGTDKNLSSAKPTSAALQAAAHQPGLLVLLVVTVTGHSVGPGAVNKQQGSKNCLRR